MSKKQKTELQNLRKLIASGIFKDSYLVYNRKSTDDADNQKNSIAYQKKENVQFAKTLGLKLPLITIEGFCADGVISERHSGFKENEEFEISNEGIVQFKINRPKFQMLVHYLSKEYFKGMICYSWDRASRNKGDSTVLRRLIKSGTDIRFVTADYDKSSAGALHMDVDEMFSIHHSRVTSEKVTIAAKLARSRGLCTYKAPIGYLNVGKMEHKPKDEDRAPIIKRLFELYSTGEWSISDLKRYCDKQGLTNVPTRPKRTREQLNAEEEVILDKVCYPITRATIHRILRNTFYIGKIKDHQGFLVDSNSHKPLITEALFNKVQSKLSSKYRSAYYSEKIDLPLRGKIRCLDCLTIYSPYRKKGHLYFLSRCSSTCANKVKNMSFAKVSGLILYGLHELTPSDDVLFKLGENLSQYAELFENNQKQALVDIELRQKRLVGERSYLETQKLSLLKAGVYTPESYMKEYAELSQEIDQSTEQEEFSRKEVSEMVENLFSITEHLKTLIEWYKTGNQSEKEAIVKLLYTELLVSNMSLEYKLQTELDVLKLAIVSPCAHKHTYTELYALSEKLKIALEFIVNFINRQSNNDQNT